MGNFGMLEKLNQNRREIPKLAPTPPEKMPVLQQEFQESLEDTRQLWREAEPVLVSRRQKIMKDLADLQPQYFPLLDKDGNDVGGSVLVPSPPDGPQQQAIKERLDAILTGPSGKSEFYENPSGSGDGYHIPAPREQIYRQMKQLGKDYSKYLETNGLTQRPSNLSFMERAKVGMEAKQYGPGAYQRLLEIAGPDGDVVPRYNENDEIDGFWVRRSQDGQYALSDPDISGPSEMLGDIADASREVMSGVVTTLATGGAALVFPPAAPMATTAALSMTAAGAALGSELAATGLSKLGFADPDWETNALVATGLGFVSDFVPGAVGAAKGAVVSATKKAFGKIVRAGQIRTAMQHAGGVELGSEAIEREGAMIDRWLKKQGGVGLSGPEYFQSGSQAKLLALAQTLPWVSGNKDLAGVRQKAADKMYANVISRIREYKDRSIATGMAVSGQSPFAAAGESWITYRKTVDGLMQDHFGKALKDVGDGKLIPIDNAIGYLKKMTDLKGMPGAGDISSASEAMTTLDRLLGGGSKVTRTMTETTNLADTSVSSSSRKAGVSRSNTRRQATTTNLLDETSVPVESDRQTVDKVTGRLTDKSQRNASTETTSTKLTEVRKTNLDKTFEEHFETRDGRTYIDAKYFQEYIHSAGQKAWDNKGVDGLKASHFAGLKKALEADLDAVANESGIKGFINARKAYAKGKEHLETLERGMVAEVLKSSIGLPVNEADLINRLLVPGASKAEQAQPVRNLMSFMQKHNPAAAEGMIRQVFDSVLHSAKDPNTATVSPQALKAAYNKHKFGLDALTSQHPHAKMALKQMLMVADRLHWGAENIQPGMFGAGILGLWGLAKAATGDASSAIKGLALVMSTRKIGTILSDATLSKEWVKQFTVVPQHLKGKSKQVLMQTLNKRIANFSLMLTAKEIELEELSELDHEFLQNNSIGLQKGDQ